MGLAHLRNLLSHDALHLGRSLPMPFALVIRVLLGWVLIVDEAFALEKVLLAAFLTSAL
jgi:hypothetical protein